MNGSQVFEKQFKSEMKYFRGGFNYSNVLWKRKVEQESTEI